MRRKFDECPAPPKVGDTLEISVWLTGRETVEDGTRIAEDVKTALLGTISNTGLVPGPIRHIFLKPGDQRVPPVPDHIHGPDVRLLLAECDAIGFSPKPSSFLGDIEPSDLAKLRVVTRRAAGRELTDEEADRLIEQHGPDAALATIRIVH